MLHHIGEVSRMIGVAVVHGRLRAESARALRR
jgi:hypothetical protein